MNNQRVESYLRYCHQFSRQWRGDYGGYVEHMRDVARGYVLSPEERHLLNHLIDGGGYNPVWPERGEPLYSWMAALGHNDRFMLGDNGRTYLYLTG